MELHRIVVNGTNKTIDPRFLFREIGAGVLFVLLLPYVFATLWGHSGKQTTQLLAKMSCEEGKYKANIQTTWGEWTLPMEEYLVFQLAQVMPEDYEVEALMAQAILLRTEFLRSARNENTDTLTVASTHLDRWFCPDEEECDRLMVYEKAVAATKDIYLSYNGNIALCPYCKISNGKIRDVGAAWSTDSYPYLSGKTERADLLAKDYKTTVHLSKEEYVNKMNRALQGSYTEEELLGQTSFAYDEAGYVVGVSFFGETMQEDMDGEQFRHLLGLPSASFHTEENADSIIFHVTGVGHGYGMSQYGANMMATNGKTYREILNQYFPGTELAKIE